jgi:hypothetical protein
MCACHGIEQRGVQIGVTANPKTLFETSAIYVAP